LKGEETMSKKYFGFALADSMFSGTCWISRRHLSIKEAQDYLRSDEVISCCNPSHTATIDAMRKRFGIGIEIPETPPQRAQLTYGDSIVVMGVRGLPRLTERHEYSEAEISSADFAFHEYSVH
jgi:hypothetical protein